MGRRTKLWVAGMAVMALGGLSVLGVGFAGAEDEPTIRVVTPEVGQTLEPVAKIKAKEPKQAAKKEHKQKKHDKAEKKKVDKKAVERPVKREDKRPVRKKVIFRPPVPADKTLSLTVPKMGLKKSPVYNTTSHAALDQGAIKLPQSGFPWQRGANTYIAAHVLGYPGTGSYMQFAKLPDMAYGDEIILTDALGRTYTYRVTEITTVTPYDLWVIKPTPGKTTVTLQTCINPPAYDQRLIVRGELVG